MSRLEEKYNLIEQSPIERVLSDPTAFNLSKIPKASQTEDILIKVCERDGCALKHASKKIINELICETAVTQNGAALEYVPHKVFEMARMKYSDDSWAIKIYNLAIKTYGCALEYIPEEYISKEMVIQAISVEEKTEHERYRYPIAFIPRKFKTHDIYLLSVTLTPYSIKNINDTRKDYFELARVAVSKNGDAIKNVSEKYRNEKLYEDAIKSNSLAIKHIPLNCITKEISQYCFEDCFKTFSYIPSQFISEDMCIRLIKEGHFSVFPKTSYLDNPLRIIYNTIDYSQLPNDMRDRKKIIDEIINIDNKNALRLLNWNERINKRINEDSDRLILNSRGESIKPLSIKAVKYIGKIADDLTDDSLYDSIKVYPEDRIIKKYQPDVPENFLSVISKNDKLIVHDLSDYEYSSQDIFYISDIHIEHQIGKKYNETVIKKSLNNKDASALLDDILDKKISEMIMGDQQLEGLILIGGDVADNSNLSKKFYKCLCSKWKGTVISVLGNHELWDGAGLVEYGDPNYTPRKVDEIIEEYHSIASELDEHFWGASLSVLENEVYIKFKNKQTRVISEEDLRLSSDDELKNLLSSCSLIILGGIGYSGLNPKYNASMGLYHKTIDLEMDKKKAEDFKSLHDKLARCVPDKKVIVLTHTPVYDWMPENNCIANWIYINGHNHANSLCRNDNGSVVLADNQVGYKPCKWKLNSVKVDYWYDPFEGYKDGIYRITSEQYKEFYVGRGIYIDGCKYPGNLYLLKKKGLYMFLLESTTSLCMMIGGQRKKLTNDDINYYYNNMDVYGEKIRELVRPYQNALECVSKEIKQFGGTGVIHGCIVDISYFSHVYINPYDGKVTPYWALDILGRKVFSDVKNLLQKKEPDLVKKYALAVKKNSVPLLEELSHNKSSLASIPEWVLGTDIYRESRIMKSIQYIWQHNVIRIWNEEVFEGTSRISNRIEKKSESLVEDKDIKTKPLSSSIVSESQGPAQSTNTYDYSGDKSTNKYIGLTKIMKNGKKAKIIEFITRWDLTVKFEDGRIVEHRTIWEFDRGNIE